MRSKSKGKSTSRNKILYAQIMRCLTVCLRNHSGHRYSINSMEQLYARSKCGINSRNRGDKNCLRNQNLTCLALVLRSTVIIIILRNRSYKWPDATLITWMVVSSSGFASTLRCGVGVKYFSFAPNNAAKASFCFCACFDVPVSDCVMLFVSPSAAVLSLPKILVFNLPKNDCDCESFSPLPSSSLSLVAAAACFSFCSSCNLCCSCASICSSVNCGSSSSLSIPDRCRTRNENGTLRNAFSTI
mmetsp:Transcript_15279/g.23191  ORF Transcript_15279/g.23191 Transcript_15279/m.23191 type:complete len:244 (+) Transcript_15279:616-1347(+)